MLSCLAPCDLATPNFSPIPNTPGPGLSACRSPARPGSGFFYDSTLLISEVKLPQPVNKKRKVRPDFGEGPRTKSQSWIQKDAWAQPGRGCGVGWRYLSVCGSLWLLGLLSLAFEHIFLPALPWSCQELRPTCSCACLGEDSSLLLLL